MTVRAPESRRSRRTRAASGQIFTYLYRAGITVILDNRRGGMDVAALITAALEQGGTPVAILRHPELGGGAVFGYVNGAFSRLLGQPRQALVGMALEALEDQIADPVVWSTLLSAAKAATPVQIVVKISAAGGENWLDLKLSFPAATGSGPRYAVLTGHNITEARREAAREEDSRRLLAAIFTRIEAPVAIVTAEGEIMMGNPALHRMLGYSSAEMHGLRV